MKLGIRFAFIVWLSVTLSPVDSGASTLVKDGKKSEKKALRKARKQERKGNYDKAEKWYKEYITDNPESYKANYELGEMLVMRSFKQNSSIPYLEKARDLIEGDTIKKSTVFYYLGKAYHFVGEFKKAS